MFRIEFETDNAAFTESEGGNREAEIARILRVIVDRIEDGATSGVARDINGNTVGRWEVV